MSAVVQVRGVEKTFSLPGPWPWSPRRDVPAVRGVDLQVAEGEIVALVGQSGSGKTTLARLVLGLEEPTAGEILLDGERWSGRPERERQALRVRYQYVPQDPMSALDPQQTPLEAVSETLRALAGRPRDQARAEATEVLTRLGLAHPAADRGRRADQRAGARSPRGGAARSLRQPARARGVYPRNARHVGGARLGSPGLCDARRPGD